MITTYSKNSKNLPDELSKALGLVPDSQIHRLICFDQSEKGIEDLRRARHDFEGTLQVFAIAIRQWQQQSSEEREIKKMQQLLTKLEKMKEVKQKYFDSIFTEELLSEMDDNRDRQP